MDRNEERAKRMKILADRSAEFDTLPLLMFGATPDNKIGIHTGMPVPLWLIQGFKSALDEMEEHIKKTTGS